MTPSMSPKSTRGDSSGDNDKLRTLARLAESIARVESGRSSVARGVDKERFERQQLIRERALTLLDYRMRSCAEMRKRLLEREEDSRLVDEVIADLRRCQLLDDVKFAREWVRQRQTRGKSRSALRYELLRKGISEEICSEALSTIAEEQEKATAEALVAKKTSAITTVPCDHKERRANLRRLLGFLARRGYPQSMAMSVCVDALEKRYQQLSSD